VISLTARVRPTGDGGAYLIRHVGDRLREFDVVRCAPCQFLVTIPGLGSALVTETRREVALNVLMRNEDAAARAGAAIMRELRNAVGGAAATDLLDVAWIREELVSAR
jgi:hypothetical protein